MPDTRKLVKKSFSAVDWLGRISRTMEKILTRLDKPLHSTGAISTGIRTAQFAIAQSPQCIANENADRNRLVVKNVNSSAGAVVFAEGDYQQAAAVLSKQGFVLNQNEREEILNSTGAIWAIAATGTIAITVFEE